MVNWIDVTKYMPATTVHGLDLRSTSLFINLEAATNIKRYKVDDLVKYSVTVGGKEHLLVAKNSTENAAIRKLLGMNDDKETKTTDTSLGLGNKS